MNRDAVDADSTDIFQSYFTKSLGLVIGIGDYSLGIPMLVIHMEQDLNLL